MSNGTSSDRTNGDWVYGPGGCWQFLNHTAEAEIAGLKCGTIDSQIPNALEDGQAIFVLKLLEYNRKYKIFSAMLRENGTYSARVGRKTPQKLTQLSSRSHPGHLAGKRTAKKKDTIKDITSDSQVNSNFPYRWSPASLTFNIYYYLFLHLYMARITVNNNTSHLKSPKNQNRRAALRRPAIKLLGGGGWGWGGGGLNLFAVDQPSPLVLLWFTRQNNYK